MSDLLVIAGPTASGKTALGVEAALAFHGEVVSADSMQIYRGMDIGTAKPSPEERRGVVHHMFDVADPTEKFSAAKYGEMAARCVEDIRSRGKLPIVVGGTGLYIDSLLRGTEYAAAPGDTGLRQTLEAEYDSLGGEAFRQKLWAVDPARAELLPPGDKKRLVRAYEVYVLTGQTITWHDEQSRLRPPRYTAVKVALDFRDRADLYDRIDRRAAMMFQQGLVEETQKLLDRGVSMDSTAMQAIGYKETAAYLRGECSLAEAVETVQRKSRQYAKRQLTWFRRDKDIQWIRWEKEPNISAVLASARQGSTEIFGL
jgi:tRNA dimethylallyltransferase